MSKSIASGYVSVTLQTLLQKLSLSFDAESLPSLLMGNMVTSVMCNYATPLRIALFILIHRKKIIKHLFDYKATCSYDELMRFKKSFAIARGNILREEEKSPVTVDGLSQHIVDNFEDLMEMYRPMIECFPETHRTTKSEFVIHITKEEISQPIRFDEEAEILPSDSQ